MAETNFVQSFSKKRQVGSRLTLWFPEDSIE